MNPKVVEAVLRYIMCMCYGYIMYGFFERKDYIGLGVMILMLLLFVAYTILCRHHLPKHKYDERWKSNSKGTGAQEAHIGRTRQ